MALCLIANWLVRYWNNNHFNFWHWPQTSWGYKSVQFWNAHFNLWQWPQTSRAYKRFIVMKFCDERHEWSRCDFRQVELTKVLLLWSFAMKDTKEVDVDVNFEIWITLDFGLCICTGVYFIFYINIYICCKYGVLYINIYF